MARAARVLVVDDDAEILETLTEFLTLHGYEVTTAQNGGEALMLLAVAPADVVLLDIAMPRVDGVTALRRIRVDHPDLPIIMLSANSDIDMARRTLSQGAFDYVTKPIGFAHLAMVVEAAIARRGR